MARNKQYRIDLWLFIGSVLVMLFILMMNLMFSESHDNKTFRNLMEWVTLPVFAIGICIPVVMVFRSIVKKTESKSLALLTILFSLLTAILIGYTTLLN